MPQGHTAQGTDRRKSVQVKGRIQQICKEGDLEQLKQILGTQYGGILDGGADIILPERDSSMMHIAAESNNVPILEFLFDSGMWIDIKDRNKTTPLTCACLNNKVDAVKYLLSKGADVNARDNEFRTPLSVSIQNGFFHIADLLLAANVDTAMGTNDKKQPILNASCEKGDESGVKYLLSKDVPLLHVDGAGESCLMASLAHPNIVSLICLKARIQSQLLKLVRIRNTAGQIVTHALTRESCKFESAKLILSQVQIGSTRTLFDILNDQDTRLQNTPLHLVLYNMNKLNLFMTYHKYLQFDLQNSKGDTVLHEAVVRKNSDILSVLLRYRKDLKYINIQNKLGQTAEMIALEMSILGTFQEILEFEKQHALLTTPVDQLRELYQQATHTIVTFLPETQCIESTLVAYNSVLDATYAAGGEILIVTSLKQETLDEMRYQYDLRYELLSDKANAIATKYQIKPQKKRRSLLEALSPSKIKEIPEPQAIVLSAQGQVIYRNSRGVDSSSPLDIARVMSYYYRSGSTIEGVRDFKMKEQDDVFDWILQNPVFCNLFAAQISLGDESKNIQEIVSNDRNNTPLDKRRKSVLDDHEYVVDLYKKYIKKHKCELKPHILLGTAPKKEKIDPNNIFQMEQNRKELRREAFKCLIQDVHYSEDLDEIMNKLYVTILTN
jgi:ankyrin repeat protein